jgi:quinol monooxygenase YgiN
MHRFTALITISALSTLLLACDGGDEDRDQTGNDLQTCVEDDFMAQPLAGTGYDPEQGLLEPRQGTYVASTTFLILDPEQTQRFQELVGAIMADLQTREGLVALSLGTSQKCGTARTMTLWKSQEAMMEFVFSPAHTAAMAEANVVGLNGATTSWEVAADEVPMSWELARTKIAEVDALY